MRLIDADAVKDVIAELNENGYDISPSDLALVRNILLRMPTIAAVPVVRCKDCKHRPIDTGGHNYGQDLLFPDDYKCPCRCGDQWYSWMPGDDWFCANGERREE